MDGQFSLEVEGEISGNRRRPTDVDRSREPSGGMAIQEEFGQRGAGRIRTGDGGFAIRCLSHLATAPLCLFFGFFSPRPTCDDHWLTPALTPRIIHGLENDTHSDNNRVSVTPSETHESKMASTPHSTTKVSADKTRILDAARKVKREQRVPLLVHNTLRWARKINGSLHYFGRVDTGSPDLGSGAAVAEYNRTIDDLRAGRTPRPKEAEVTRLADAVNAFLEAKDALRESGEITSRSCSDYQATCGRMIDVLGRDRALIDLTPADLRTLRKAFAKGRGPVALANEVRRARMVFKFAWDEGLIDRPVRYGQGFDMPSTKTLRQARAAKGIRMFEADELRRLIEAADPILKAGILLGINCGFGQADLARLPQSAVDLKGGWVNFPRPITGVSRKCPLWPETAAALRTAIEARPAPKDAGNAELVFLTPNGYPVVRTQESKRQRAKGKEGRILNVDAVARVLKKLTTQLEIDGNRSFYALRHTFETIGGDTGDQVAVSAIMGHAPRAGDMSAVYRDRIDDARLIAVTDHVRAWLWPDRCVAE